MNWLIVSTREKWEGTLHISVSFNGSWCPCILSNIGEFKVALMLNTFGSRYSQQMEELGNIIIKNKNLFERTVLTRFLSQIWFWRFFVHPTFFWSFIESTTDMKEKIYDEISSKYREYHHEILCSVSHVSQIFLYFFFYYGIVLSHTFHWLVIRAHTFHWLVIRDMFYCYNRYLKRILVRQCFNSCSL